MKKRFFNGFLAVAMLIASVGTFVSCKDHEEDNYSDLKGQLAEQNATLRELIDAQIANLQSQIKKLEEAQAACKQECAAKIAELKGFVVDNYETKEHANAQYEKLANEIAALKAADAQLSLAIEELRKTTKEAIDRLDGRIDATNSRIDEVLKLISDIQIAVNKADALAQSAYDLAKKAFDLATEANTKALEAFEKAVNNETIISIWTPKWEQTMKDASEALAKALANELAIANLLKTHQEFEAKDAALSARIDSLANVIKNLQVTQDLEGVRKMIEDAFNDAIRYTDTQIAIVQKQIEALNKDVEGLETKVNGLEVKISELQKAYEAADEQLKKEIKAVDDKVTALESRVKANELAIAEITGEIDEIWNALKAQVTGIVLQGTYNNILGSINLPLNVNSNILAAYYGEAGSEGLEFPTARPKYYVNPDNVILTSADLKILGSIETFTSNSGDVLVGAEGNAGTLYMTINPNTVDFSGVVLPLVNSLDEDAGVVLSGLEKSSQKLTFGYTRADNGFYEAKATINEANISKVKTISIEDFKSVASDVVGGNRSLSTIVNALYNALNEMEMDANGVKATWNDGTQDHTVYSQYGIAAAAIKPLGFSFGSDFDYSLSIPGLESAEKLVSKILDKIKIELPNFDFEMHDFEIKDLEIIELDNSELAANFKVEIKDKNGELIETVDFTKGIKEIYGDATAPLDDVNKLLADLRLYLDDVNDVIEQLKKVNDIEDDIENIKGDIKSEISKYFDIFNKKFSNIINSINKALRPVLLVKTESGYHKLSQSVSIPTRIEGTKFIVAPTSYTAEYLAPAYKKFVAVTNVYKVSDLSVNAQGGDASCLAALNAANKQTDYAKVLDGGKQLMEFNAEEGYVYEILYTAADFYGYVDAKKFYVVAE